MRVEITEDRLSDTDPDTGRHFALEKGDMITVPDACGERWCGYGWATDVDGNHPSGERVPGVGVRIEPQNATLGGK